jgi:hypothetical protein
MASTYIGSMWWFRACIFHVRVAAYIKSETSWGGFRRHGHTGRRLKSLSTQLSSQTLVDLPQRCAWSSLVSVHHVLHIVISKYEKGYFQEGHLSIRALKELRSINTRHTCRASRARLKISISLNPSPPLYFGIAIDSQEIHAVFLSPFLPPHQNFLINDVICWQRPRGSLKSAIE